MSIRIDHNGKKKPLLCEAKKPETNYGLHLHINKEKEFKERKRSNRAIKKLNISKVCSTFFLKHTGISRQGPGFPG